MNLGWANYNLVIAYDMFSDYIKLLLESNEGRCTLANCDQKSLIVFDQYV